jgi:hypothetical protein
MNICQDRFRFTKEDQNLSVPCCWSHPIDAPNKEIERAVIVVHGVLRNADEYYAHMMEALRAAGVEYNTLVIAPQFLLEEDVAEFDLAEAVLFWGGETGEGWKKGNEPISTEDHPRLAAASSFEVVDRMIEQIALMGVFPNLRQVVVIGHSAGGQYVNRYAAGTLIGKSFPEDIHLRFIVANPSTFVYFNGERRLPETTSEFAIPESADPDYNDYKYGLENLNPYMAAVGAETIRSLYPKKDVVYLLGGEDIEEAYLEQSANAMLQGRHRLERGQVYYHYLQHYFGEEITQTQKIAIIPCVGHDHAAIFKSEAGLKHLFG